MSASPPVPPLVHSPEVKAPNGVFEQWLTTRGVRHTWVETPGGHSFLVWRCYLARLVPQLFQPGSVPATK